VFHAATVFPWMTPTTILKVRLGVMSVVDYYK